MQSCSGYDNNDRLLLALAPLLCILVHITCSFRLEHAVSETTKSFESSDDAEPTDLETEMEFTTAPPVSILIYF